MAMSLQHPTVNSFSILVAFRSISISNLSIYLNQTSVSEKANYPPAVFRDLYELYKSLHIHLYFLKCILLLLSMEISKYKYDLHTSHRAILRSLI